MVNCKAFMWTARVSFVLIALSCALTSHAQLTLTEGTNLSADGHPTAGVVFDLLGGIWALEDGATTAQALLNIEAGARQPQWSPDGQRILFARPTPGDIAVLDTADATVTVLAPGSDPRWHPNGERALYVGRDREGRSQLFEIDLATGLKWQLTHSADAAVAGAWSADGRQLAYITRGSGRYQLRLRNMRGDRVLVESTDRLSSPSIRPDNSLVSFIRHGEELTMDMAIVSDPVLVRTLIREPDLFDAPIVWRSRQAMLYTANGKLRRRQFNSWVPRNIPFRASIEVPENQVPVYALAAPQRNGEPWVLRVRKLFDGRRAQLRDSVDIVIHGDTIVAVETPGDRGTLQVINMGQAIAMPGLIDACARPPADEREARALLAHGILTLVPNTTPPDHTDWEVFPTMLAPDCSDAVAEKRYAAQQLARVSPAGIEYQDSRLSVSGQTSMLLSGLARPPGDGTPDPLSDAVFSGSPIAGQLVLASAVNQWPVELAALAELATLSGGPRDGFDALLAATGTAANYLGLRGRIGVLEPGARADIVLLTGNPGEDLRTLGSPIAIVRAGQLFGRNALLSR